MASPSYAETLLGGIDQNLKRALRVMLEYVLANLRFGRPSATKRDGNFQLYRISGKTPAVAGQEFSIPHNLGVPPYLAIPVLDLQKPGSRMIRLGVTRAADSQRVYLSSPNGDQEEFILLIEG